MKTFTVGQHTRHTSYCGTQGLLGSRRQNDPASAQCRWSELRGAGEATRACPAGAGGHGAWASTPGGPPHRTHPRADGKGVRSNTTEQRRKRQARLQATRGGGERQRRLATRDCHGHVRARPTQEEVDPDVPDLRPLSKQRNACTWSDA